MPQRPPATALRLGSRGSALARAQAETMRRALAERCGIATELVIVTTSGDRIQDRPLADAGGKGLFTKELEAALLSGEIDLAVHSMKDVPVQLPAGLTIAATPVREDPRDAFLSREGFTIETLPRGARIGTSSVRRAAQVKRARQDLSVVALRGNVDTRLRKLDAGEIDGLLLALAGLRRLNCDGRVTAALPSSQWLPALSQGALGIEMREHDDAIAAIRGQLNHTATEVALACERAFQEALDGSCRTPIAGLATFEEPGVLTFAGEVLAPDGSDHVATQFAKSLGADPVREARDAGRDAANGVKARARAWLVV
ncbi:MAG TPA: hydroxymethylbilane synthase [Rhizomicrobium sp.]|jgi:hydroxymethylbilane synthase